MKPLAGVRVLDLTVAVAGPVAAHLLGDLGAEVIRIEPPFARPLAHMDVSPPATGAAGSHPHDRIVSYNDLQRSKLGMTLDLSQDSGRDIFLKLAAISDVVIENMAPRVLAQLRIAFDDLRAANERIILVRMPAFGLDGPWRDRVSYGPGIDALSGLAWLTGYPDRGPMNASLYYCDYNAGALAAFATVVALRARDRAAQAQCVELAMLEGELQLVADALLDVQMNTRAPFRRGNVHPTMAPHGVYPCAGHDRWVAIACEDDAQWRALCHAIAQPHLAQDPRYADVISRVHRRREIDAIVSAWTQNQDPHAAAGILQAAGVPAGAVHDMRDLLHDPQFTARDAIQWTQHPAAGAIPHTRAAFTFEREPVRIETPAPTYAQHLDDVLRDLLHLTPDRIAALEAEGIIRRAPPDQPRL